MSNPPELPARLTRPDAQMVVDELNKRAYEAKTGPAGGDLTGNFPNPTIGEGKVTSAKILNGTVSDTDLASPNNSVYRTLLFAASPAAAGTVAGTYILNSPDSSTLQATNQTRSVPIAYLDPADFAVAGKTTKYRVRAQVYVNGTAPISTFTFGLYPVSTVAGAEGGITWNTGTVTSGSTVPFAAPAKESRNQGNSGDFTAPEANHFVLAVAISVATIAAKSWVAWSAQLQVRNT